MWGAAPRGSRILILLGVCAAIVFGCVHSATAASRQASGAIDDFNGDGKSDFAFFRPSTDLWSVRNVANVTWGASGDIPVPGDYNGDNKTDYAFFRPSTGVWSIRNIANITWGMSGDIPVPGDYNGDNKTDTAVFRR